jgi:hypothetical protein
MSRFKRKINWKKIISIVLVGVLLVGAVAGLGSVFGKDTKTISPTVFSVGGINDEGKHVDTKTSIYTKEMFECQGLSIEPDFEATGTYKVFYYDSHKNFMKATDAMSASNGAYTMGESVFGASYARVMITPDVPLDEDGEAVEDYKIRFYEVVGIANEYKITVDKKQDSYRLTDFVHETRIPGKTYGFDENGHIREDSANETVTVYGAFDVSEFSSLAMKIETTGGAGNGHILFVDADDNKVDTYSYLLGEAQYVEEGVILIKDIEVPKNAVKCYIVGCTAMSYMSVYGK